MSDNDTATDEESSDRPHFLSRNPIVGLRMLEETSLHSILTKRMAATPDFNAAALCYRIIKDLASEIDRLAAEYGQTTPSICDAVAGLVARPVSHGNQPFLAPCKFGPALRDVTIDNLLNYLTRANLPAPMARSEHAEIRERIEDLVSRLESDPPSGQAAEAALVAHDLRNGALQTLIVGEQLDFCFLTPSAASDVGGQLITRSLKWGLQGHTEWAAILFELSIAILGLFHWEAGAVGIGIGAYGLLEKAGLTGPRALLPGATEEE